MDKRSFADAGAQAFYEAQWALYEQLHGEMTVAAESVLAKAAEMERLARLAQDSLYESGLREKYPASKYRDGTRENKAFSQYLKASTQQAKLLRELRLLPGSRRAAAEEDDEAGDEPDELDDY